MLKLQALTSFRTDLKRLEEKASASAQLTLRVRWETGVAEDVPGGTSNPTRSGRAFDVCMEKLKVGECRDMTRNLAPKSPDICHSMSSIIPFSWLYLVTSSVAICALWIQRSTVVPVVCFLHLQVTNLADEVEALRKDIHQDLVSEAATCNGSFSNRQPTPPSFDWVVTWMLEPWHRWKRRSLERHWLRMIGERCVVSSMSLNESVLMLGSD